MINDLEARIPAHTNACQRAIDIEAGIAERGSDPGSLHALCA